METEITFILNNQQIVTKSNSGIVLLDFIRKDQKLTGTKEVCKEGDCGACAVLLGEIENDGLKYKIINSCLYPLLKVRNKHVVTIEGLNLETLNPIQRAFLEEGASQCGYCTPGFIISFTGYLVSNSEFEIKKAINSIAGNICRCTGYHSIIRALERIGKNLDLIDTPVLIRQKLIPEYFENIEERLKELIKSSSSTSAAESDKIVSGGTDLFVQEPETFQETDFMLSEDIIDKGIRLQKDEIIISGASSLEDFKDFLENNDVNINLGDLFDLFASLPIRNSATIAGNIVNASPIADITISLLALNATLSLKNHKNNKREIPLNKFFKGYKNIDKKNDEIIDRIKIKIPPDGTRFNFEKVSKRRYMDIASVNTAISIREEGLIISELSVSAGGVAPIPLFLDKFAEQLKGKRINNDLIVNITDLLSEEISPISDIRGSAEYKRLLLTQLIKAHFLELFPESITSEAFV